MTGTHPAGKDGDRSPRTAIDVQYHLLDDLFSTLLNLELFRCAAELEHRQEEPRVGSPRGFTAPQGW